MECQETDVNFVYILTFKFFFQICGIKKLCNFSFLVSYKESLLKAEKKLGNGEKNLWCFVNVHMYTMNDICVYIYVVTNEVIIIFKLCPHPHLHTPTHPSYLFQEKREFIVLKHEKYLVCLTPMT